ncbi:MAG: rhodanese-like domain-containing protein, partial [Planctomycetota bacterium]|nr:rhodanese-like domain-containing protein [Planctomycetota bacterium]
LKVPRWIIVEPDASRYPRPLLETVQECQDAMKAGKTGKAQELAEKAPFLLDVREAAELEKDGYIEGAVHIPVRQVLENLDKLPAQDQPIVVYCASGHRGGFVTAALKLLGYSNVRNLAGGLGAWKKAELPVVTGSMPEAPKAGTAPEIKDQALYELLKGFFAELPEGFYTIKADKLNADIAEGKTYNLIDVR